MKPYRERARVLDAFGDVEVVQSDVETRPDLYTYECSVRVNGELIHYYRYNF